MRRYLYLIFLCMNFMYSWDICHSLHRRAFNQFQPESVNLQGFTRLSYSRANSTCEEMTRGGVRLWCKSQSTENRSDGSTRVHPTQSARFPLQHVNFNRYIIYTCTTACRKCWMRSRMLIITIDHFSANVTISLDHSFLPRCDVVSIVCAYIIITHGEAALS